MLWDTIVSLLLRYSLCSWLVLVQNVNMYAWGVWVIKFVYNCALYNILLTNRAHNSDQISSFRLTFLFVDLFFFSCDVSNWLWISFRQKSIAINLLHPFQNIKCLGFSICIGFAMHLYIHCILIHSEMKVSIKIKISYNLEWMENLSSTGWIRFVLSIFLLNEVVKQLDA